MTYDIKDLPKSEKEIKVTVAADEIKPFMERAAVDLSQKVKIEGFRPGKATYDVVAKRVGEMAILEEALPRLVQKQLVEIIKKESLETVGEPSINVEKAAPGNEVIFTAKVSLYPALKKMADYKSIKVEGKDVSVKEEEVEKVISELRKMQSAEVEVEREATAADKVTVDMAMAIDKVAVEGGTTKGHAIYLNEPYYIPGLNEKILGMKKGEQKVFTLTFPKDNFNKNLAGKEVEFTVDMKGVHEIKHPELDDFFAKRLGQENMEKLRALLRKNLEDEARTKEEQRQEAAALEELLKKSEIEDAPTLLVNSEAHRMMHEMERSIAKQGMAFADYLKSIGKTHDELLLDFVPDAVKRVKSMVVMREISRRENLEPTDKEALDEQLKILNMYADDPETQARVRSEDGEEYIRAMLKNRKVLQFIRETMIKK
ncbi:MAG: trigger factor [Patescibacteria group bacterium]|nr:MAG: trigger factor [Patescibacteria group bacterium]